MTALRMPIRATLILSGLIALGACSGAGSGAITESAVARSGPAGAIKNAPWEQPVRQAVCNAHDRTETGLQGQVPLVDRVSGRSQQGYNCNLDLVGQWQGDGASWQMAWHDDCAYYGTRGDTSRENPGVVVIDASNTSNPRPSAYLSTAPMIDPWESLKVNDRRQLLGAVDGLDGGGGPDFDVYDVSGDCSQPRLLSSSPMGETSGHEGNWMQDGMTYWGANGNYNAFDVTDPANPELIKEWAPPAGTHGVAFNADGSRGYFTHVGLGGALGPAGEPLNGFVIADTSEVQNRVDDPEIEIISTTLWPDGSAGQHPMPIKIAGKSYVLYTDELGAAFAGSSGPALASCGQGLSPFGMPRLFDISDESNPKLVAKFMLETHDPDNCPQVMPDVIGTQVIFSYDSHYCSVDDPENATVLGCGYFNSGIRVFDIRDPYFPREIAYYNPPAQLDKQLELAGSQHAAFLGATGGLLTADWCSAQVRFIPERGELWTTCQDNGFMVLRFADGVWPFVD